MSTPASSACFLFDNGSLRAESTLSLRRVAAALEARTGQCVQAVSLLHSSNVPASDLGGRAARLLEPALADYFTQQPSAEAVLLPLFFGPSAALTEYVPERMRALAKRFPQARFRLAPWLVDPAESADTRMAAILADRVRSSAEEAGWIQPQVVLVDHGSPQPAVAQVRNHLGAQLRELLGDRVSGLAVASMERREGDAYAFNEPLLATVLKTPPFSRSQVIVALQFLSPGRHAGPGGDIAEICRQAGSEQPGLQTRTTETIAGDPRLVDLLAERWIQAVRP